ncbi:MAG TPA: YCF48-related protein [Rhodocyclaceae bacterium]|nr:YCF48-related protein [Rhodocyclaceae bacterium]
MHRPTLIAAFALLAGTLPAMPAQANTMADPLDRPALISSLASRAVMLDLTRAGTQAGSRLVAVGERGIVLLSDDQGGTWRQAVVPVSVSLTAVAFADARIGWVVGHSGVILKTEDGGEHWKLQLDGRQVADRIAKSGVSEAAAQRWLKDGADKPFLALHVADAKSVQVVGAFGLAFRSRDGGATWDDFGDKLDNPKGNHLYAIAVQDEHMFIAGEQACFFASNDGGMTFKRLGLPYKGSLFELHPTAKGLFAVGMKGKLLFTPDQGKTWSDVANPMPVSLLSVTTLPNGKQLWLNQAGQFLMGGEDAQPLMPLQGLAAPAAIRATVADSKRLVTAGFRGVSVQPWTH